MKSTWMAVPIAFAVLALDGSPWSLGQSSTAGSSGQTPKKSTSAQSPTLTPQEKEAQKHYRIALEAIKNNDFTTASDELKTAADLAPKNALIWYNLAVVESKKGDSKPALDHLQKAEGLGLPKNLRDDANQLEAKLTYEVKRDAKKETFSAKMLELKEEMAKGGNGQCQDAQNAPIVGQESWGYGLVPQINPRTVLIGIQYHEYTFFQQPFGGIHSLDVNGTAAFDFADVSPDLEIIQIPVCHIGRYRWRIVMKAKKQGAFHLLGKTKEFVPHVETHSGENRETVWVDSDALELNFSGQDSAQSAAKMLSELIRMSAGIQ